MGKFIRYALATVCFAASVGCLALWQRSAKQRDVFMGPSFILPNQALGFAASSGFGSAHLIPGRFFQGKPWVYSTTSITDSERVAKDRFVAERGYFAVMEPGDDGAAIYFPLWYPALVSALAGVGVLRFQRQFSVRAGLITVTIVAAMLGIVVAL